MTDLMGVVMQHSVGFFVVERINWFDKEKFPHIPERKPSVPGSHVEILRRYRGIEGSGWPEGLDGFQITLSAGLADLSQEQAVHEYCRHLRGSEGSPIVDCILCQKVECLSNFAHPENGLRFLGFDYGYLVCETNNYSVVFNEVVYGRHAQFTTFASSLNEHCLLPSIETIQAVQNVRLELLVDAANIEADEECWPFAVYECPHR